MIFLVKVEIERKPDATVEEFFDLIQKEWEMFERLKRRGKVLAGGKLAGRRGAAAIFDVEDNNEIEEVVSKLPLFPFFTSVEIIPLVPSEKALEDARRMNVLIKNSKSKDWEF